MNKAVIAGLLISCASWASAQEWHRVASTFCSQIKAKGAKVSGRPFSVYRVNEENSKCCEGLNLTVQGKTADFGHFRVLGLDRGRYFLSFDLKTKQINVPILVDWLVDKRYAGKDCEPNSRITVDRKTNQVSWEEWVTVD